MAKIKQCLTFSQQTHVAQQVRLLSALAMVVDIVQKNSRKTREELGFKVNGMVTDSI